MRLDNGLKTRIFIFMPLCCLAATLAWAIPARAATLTASQILQDFNVVTLGNFSSSADVEGAAVIGGNLTGNATFDLNPSAEAASAFGALTVYGNDTSGGSLNLDNGGSAYIAGSNNAMVSLNGSAYIGGNNSGSITTGGANASVDVLGSNSATLTLNGGGSVYVGAGNSGQVSISGGSTATNSVAINGGNTNSLTLNNGGTVQVSGNAGRGSLNGGSLTYTGSIGSWNLNGGATASQVASINLAPPANSTPSFASTFAAPLTALSTQLAGLTSTSNVVVNGNSVTLEAAPNVSGVAVLALSTSMFTANSTVSIALNGATSFIIDVTIAGCTSTCAYSFPTSVNFLNPTTYADDVLWNFSDASSLTFGTEFGGTVLAVDAAVSNTNSIDGDVIAQTFTGTGELHDYPYDGVLPGTSITITSNGLPAPEPSALAVLSVAVAGLAAMRWRRRAVA